MDLNALQVVISRNMSIHVQSINEDIYLSSPCTLLAGKVRCSINADKLLTLSRELFRGFEKAIRNVPKTICILTEKQNRTINDKDTVINK